jgi:hypothetical protein
MSYFRKKLERRTFSQDRYYILIKRQKAGEATLRDLDELDEIVNRDPDIREKVLRENFEEFANMDEGQQDNDLEQDTIIRPTPVRRSLWTRITSFFRNLFASDTTISTQKFSALC